MVCYSTITPRIIGIGHKLVAKVVIYRNNIALQILFEPVTVKHTFRIRGLFVLHTDGSSIRIVDIHQKITIPLFRNNLRTVEVVDVLNAVDRFACADSFVMRKTVEGSLIPPTVSSLGSKNVTAKLKLFQITYHKWNEIALYQQASPLVAQTQTCWDSPKPLCSKSFL